MRKKTKLIAKHKEKLMIIGLIGGILAIAGVFGPEACGILCGQILC